MSDQLFNIRQQAQTIEQVEEYKFDEIKGYPMLHWKGKRPFRSTCFFPAQLKETYGEPAEFNGKDWINKIFWGDNLQVMSHLLKQYRGQVDLIYIDPPFDSKADYKKTISIRGQKAESDATSFETKQYTDIWSNDEYLQFMYERLILCRELLSEDGSIYLHCDWHKNAQLRCILDEIFGSSNIVNEIVWTYYGPGSPGMRQFNRKHDIIYWYCKNGKWIFNDSEIRIDHNEKTIDNFKTGLQGSGFTSDNYEIPEGKIPEDWWNFAIASRYPKDGIKYSGYPTEKPMPLLERIIKASSNPGDLVFDCFMGSGTTQAVAMKLGRRFIGADINLGAIETTTKRLLKIQNELTSKQGKLDFEGEDSADTLYTGFELYNVNNYDVFHNPVQAHDLLLEALEIQPLDRNSVFDGIKDDRMIKIMPVNRIATKHDLNELIMGFDYKTFDERRDKNPLSPVEHITLVCMGHDNDLAATLKDEMKKKGYNIDIEIFDILHDRGQLQFKRDSTANIVCENGKLVVKEFYPMNLLAKLSFEKESVEDWRVLVDSIKIDWNYDSTNFTPTELDIPEKDQLVKGEYRIPSDAGSIRIKITDLLSESLELTIQ